MRRRRGPWQTNGGGPHHGHSDAKKAAGRKAQDKAKKPTGSKEVPQGTAAKKGKAPPAEAGG